MPATSGGARARELVAADPKAYMIEQAVCPLTGLFGVIIFLALGVAPRDLDRRWALIAARLRAARAYCSSCVGGHARSRGRRRCGGGAGECLHSLVRACRAPPMVAVERMQEQLRRGPCFESVSR
jgi:hypothetical protein